MSDADEASFHARRAAVAMPSSVPPGLRVEPMRAHQARPVRECKEPGWEILDSQLFLATDPVRRATVESATDPFADTAR